VESYRITPRQRTYVVEAVTSDGRCRLIGAWPTEELAVSRLKELQRRAEISDLQTPLPSLLLPTAQDRRG